MRPEWMGIFYRMWDGKQKILNWRWNVWDHDDRVSVTVGDDSSWLMRCGGKDSWSWGYQERRDQGLMGSLCMNAAVFNN